MLRPQSNNICKESSNLPAQYAMSINTAMNVAIKANSFFHTKKETFWIRIILEGFLHN